MHGYFFKKSTSCRFWWLMKQLVVIRFIKGVFCHCHPYSCYFHNIIYLFPNCIVVAHDVGNKAKGQILKRVFQENKPRQIFRKTNISYYLIRTRTYQMCKKCLFLGKFGVLCFLKHPIWDSPFWLITDDVQYENQTR